MEDVKQSISKFPCPLTSNIYMIEATLMRIKDKKGMYVGQFMDSFTSITELFIFEDRDKVVEIIKDNVYYLEVYNHMGVLVYLKKGDTIEVDLERFVEE